MNISPIKLSFCSKISQRTPYIKKTDIVNLEYTPNPLASQEGKPDKKLGQYVELYKAQPPESRDLCKFSLYTPPKKTSGNEKFLERELKQAKEAGDTDLEQVITALAENMNNPEAEFIDLILDIKKQKYEQF